MRRSSLVMAFLGLAVLGVTCPAQTAGNKYGELLKRLPDQANLLMLVDVEAVFNSPMGKAEGWLDEAVERSQSRLGMGDQIKLLTLAVNLDLSSMTERWKLGLAALKSPLPDLKALATREGGFIEEGFATPAVWTPRGFHLVAFPPTTIGYVMNADRASLKAWIDKTLTKPRTFPPGFADRAIFRAEKDSQVVIALNLADALSAPIVEPWLNTIDEVKKAGLDSSLLAQRLATAKSAFLEISINEFIQGTIRVEFEQDITYAAPVAKPILITVLEDKGAALPDFDSWFIRVQGNVLEATGRMSIDSLRTVLAMATPPELSRARPASFGEEPAPGQPPVTEESAKSDTVRTNQAYFNSVVDALNGLKSVKRPTYASTKLWYDRYAQQIEQLPILGVDKDLLDWGLNVAKTVRGMSSGINYSAQNQVYTLAEQPNGFGGFSYGGYGFYYANSKSYDQAVIKRQSNAQLSVALDGTWQGLETSIASVRRTMTERYQVEF